MNLRKYNLPYDVCDQAVQRNVAELFTVYNVYDLYPYIINISLYTAGTAIGDRQKGRTRRTQVVRKSMFPGNGMNVSDDSHLSDHQRPGGEG